MALRMNTNGPDPNGVRPRRTGGVFTAAARMLGAAGLLVPLMPADTVGAEAGLTVVICTSAGRQAVPFPLEGGKDGPEGPGPSPGAACHAPCVTERRNKLPTPPGEGE